MRVLAIIAIAAVVVCSSVVAQQRNPGVGEAPVGEPSADARAARRAIMHDSIERQYTGPELEEYRSAIDSYDRAKSGVYQEGAKVVRRRVSVGLAPDSEVPELRLNAENAGALVFTDSLGSPWRVADVVAPGYLAVQKYENMVILRPAATTGQQAPVRFTRGSITVLLEGLSSTVTFAVSYGLSKEVDGQLEAQIQARNPAASVNAVQGGSIETDDAFGLFLDGEPPRGASKVKTTLKAVEAWMYQNHLYVRTILSLHSPAFRMYGGSAAGINVYRFDRIPSVINAIKDGVIVSIGIGD